MTLFGPLLSVLLVAAPGLLLARRLAAPDPCAHGFVLATASLFSATLLAQLLGLPLGFASVGAGLGLLAGGLALAERRAAPPPCGPWRPPGPRAAWAVVALLCAILAVRCALQPLSGFDTVFRWGYLAQLLLEQRSLDFYPPRSTEDFRLYAYIDGIPPLVSTCYWWLYAGAGKVLPRWTALPVVLQWLCAVGLVARIGARLGGARAGALSALALACAPLFLRSLAIGQEAGFVALAVAAGTSAVVDADPERDDPRRMVLAGLAFGLAPLAREWGWALLPCAAWLARRRGRSRRELLVLACAAAALAAPWYLRTLVLTGNPIYDLPFAGVFPLNPVHRGVTEQVWTHAAWGRGLGAKLASLGLELGAYAPLQALVGLPAAWIYRDRLRGFGFLVAANALLFALAVPNSVGGVRYTARVLTPSLVLLSLPVGLLADDFLRRAWGRRLLWGLGAPLGAWTLLVAVLFPARPGALPPRAWPRYLVATERLTGYPVERFLPPLARGVLPPGARILAPTDAAAQVALRPLGYGVVPCWSPEVAFACTQRPYVDVAAALRRRGIAYVLHDPANPANAFLMRFPFYREGLARWLPLGKAGSKILFEIPPVRARQAPLRPSRG